MDLAPRSTKSMEHFKEFFENTILLELGKITHQFHWLHRNNDLFFFFLLCASSAKCLNHDPFPSHS